jgi:hypothetical protein
MEIFKQKFGELSDKTEVSCWTLINENGLTAKVLDYGATIQSMIVPDKNGNPVSETDAMWHRPRERTMYIMLSSHTDIGLHNSQYIQRYNSSRFLDMAKQLCDATEDRAEHDRYRYVMEGTWFWNNYGMDRGRPVAQELLRDYVQTGKMGICCGIAGNHTQVYGLEEMCRHAYAWQSQNPNGYDD